jgi:hypothetical protein
LQLVVPALGESLAILAPAREVTLDHLSSGARRGEATPRFVDNLELVVMCPGGALELVDHHGELVPTAIDVPIGEHEARRSRRM